MRLILKHLLICIICTLTSVIDLRADDTINLSGTIFDAVTSKELDGAKVEVLSQDSTIIGSTIASSSSYTIFGEMKHAKFHINIPKVAGEYILKVSHDGYDTFYQDIDMTDLGTRQTEYEIDKIFHGSRYARPDQKHHL